jgi:hypothetical protein
MRLAYNGAKVVAATSINRRSAARLRAPCCMARRSAGRSSTTRRRARPICSRPAPPYCVQERCCSRRGPSGQLRAPQANDNRRNANCCEGMGAMSTGARRFPVLTSQSLKSSRRMRENDPLQTDNHKDSGPSRYRFLVSGTTASIASNAAYHHPMRSLMFAPRPHSTAADLVRLLVCWLTAIMLLQGVAAAQALGRGPLHRHSEAANLAVAQHHHHYHGAAERHHHTSGDRGVLPVPSADASFDAAAFAITAALVLMAIATARAAIADPRRHVWRAAALWAWRTTVPVLPLKPPRAT